MFAIYSIEFNLRVRTLIIYENDLHTLPHIGGRCTSGMLHGVLIIMGSISIYKPVLKPIALFCGF